MEAGLGLETFVSRFPVDYKDGGCVLMLGTQRPIRIYIV